MTALTVCINRCDGVAKAMEAKAMEAKAFEDKAMEASALEVKAMEAKAMEANAMEAKAIEEKAMEWKAKAMDAAAMTATMIEREGEAAPVLSPRSMSLAAAVQTAVPRVILKETIMTPRVVRRERTSSTQHLSDTLT